MSENENNKSYRNCCMPSCKDEKFDLVHKFPRNNEKAKQWLEAINIPELNKMPLDEIRRKKFICSRHFPPEAYKHAASRSLNLTAIPTLNLRYLESVDHLLPRERKPQVMHIEFIEQIDEEEVHVGKKLKLEPVQSPEKHVAKEPSPVKFVLKPVKYVPKSSKRSLEQKFTAAPSEKCVVVETISVPEQQEEVASAIEETGSSKTETPVQNVIEISDEKFPSAIKFNNYWLRDHCRCRECYDEKKSRRKNNFMKIPLDISPHSFKVEAGILTVTYHCRCEECFDKETSQRKFNFLDIPLNVRPKVYEVQNEVLEVTWSDKHKSLYDLEFLYNAQYAVKRPIYEKPLFILWDKESIQNFDYARVNLAELITDEEAVKKVLCSLVKYGVAFIEKVPANTHSTEMAVTRLFPVMRTFFGDMWKFSDQKDHMDFAYTKNFLPAHTDNTYFNDPAGLQVLHCLQHNGTGGENLVVDGFKAVADLKSKFPDSYERLAFKYQVPAEYVEEGRHHKHCDSVIKVNKLTGQVEQIRFNMNDRAVLDTVPFDDLQQFYVDMHRLAAEIQSTTNEWWFKLNPGTVLIFDNWRVLHGRKSYTGKRTMTGCYVSRTEFLSAARTYNAL